ncbi:MAG: efflux RND transporter periplasmic adaptor subunit [Deltaproteobacteria bacterium]|nr:efflux RND transporter periplasmic adaptor subunit [Deltaproteobacteria bacterium]
MFGKLLKKSLRGPEGAVAISRNQLITGDCFVRLRRTRNDTQFMDLSTTTCRIFVKLLLLCILTLSLISCERGCERYDSGTVSVIVEPVRVQESSPVVTVPGILIVRDRVEIKNSYPAKISEVFVNKGDKVAEGSILAQLSDEEINIKLSQLRAARKEAESVLEKNSYLLKNRDRLLEDGKLDKTQYESVDIENTAAEATLNRIKTDIAVAEYNAAHIQISSPISGLVIEKYASPMQVAAENQLLFTVVNVDPILVAFPLTVDESTGIRLGMPISVKIEDLDNAEYNATVTYISPEIHQTGKTFDVWAAVPNSDYVLKAGMSATAQFTSTNIHKVIVVPDSAVITRNRDKFVFTVQNGIAHETKVSIRTIHDGIAEVVNGLAENDLVVAKGAASLQDGATVDMWRR